MKKHYSSKLIKQTYTYMLDQCLNTVISPFFKRLFFFPRAFYIDDIIDTTVLLTAGIYEVNAILISPVKKRFRKIPFGRKIRKNVAVQDVNSLKVISINSMWWYMCLLKNKYTGGTPVGVTESFDSKFLTKLGHSFPKNLFMVEKAFLDS